MAPVLQHLRRPITLIVDYNPEAGIVVKTTREKVEVKGQEAKRYTIPNTDKTVKVAEVEADDIAEVRLKISRSPRTGLCVYLPNGDLIQEKRADLTMILVIQAAGI